MSIKISIITCTYNSAFFLEKNIESVKKQNYENFEHIFIDGFSTDNTLEIIKKYQSECPNVKLFSVQPKGISNAMNEGIKQSNGDYLIHLHSDDSFFDSEVLVDVVAFLDNRQLDWIYGKVNVVEEDGQSVGLFPKKKLWQQGGSRFGNYLLKFYNFIPHQGVFIKKDVFDKFGYFDETISSAMDPDLWLRIKDKTNWIFFDRVISNYCVRSDAQSSSLKNIEKNKKNYLLVQNRHLNFSERFFARVVSFMVSLINKNYR